jgi:hypothetical protein
MILTVTRSFFVKNRIYHPGEIIRVANKERLTGYARQSTKEEYQDTLDSYIDEAKKLFGETTPQVNPVDTYFACHGTDFWMSIYGAKICRTCHPPAHPGLEVNKEKR